MVDANALTARRTRRFDGHPESPADTRFFDLRESGYQGPIDGNGHPVAPGREREHLLGQVTGGDARELELADAELRHVVDQLATCIEENEALKAELAAANDAVLELLHDLEIAQQKAHDLETSQAARGER